MTQHARTETPRHKYNNYVTLSGVKRAQNFPFRGNDFYMSKQNLTLEKGGKFKIDNFDFIKSLKYSKNIIYLFKKSNI